MINEKLLQIEIFDYDGNNVTTSKMQAKYDWLIVSNYITSISNAEYVSDKTVLIFHDSFLIRSMLLYASTFKKVIFVKKTYSKKVVQKFNFDICIEIICERFLQNY
jgi:hypothetical protein